MSFIATKTQALLLVIIICITLFPSGNSNEAMDVTTLNLLWENKEGHNATLWSVRWSPDDSMISATYFDNTTTIFNAQNGSIITKMGAHPKPHGTRCDGEQDCEIEEHLPTRSSAWSPDGKYLATGGDNRLIIIYASINWSVVKILEGHEQSVLTLEWSPGGTMIASGSGTDKVAIHNEDKKENIVKIWDFSTGLVIAELEGHQDGVMNVKWSPNGSQIASASDDKKIMLWSTSDWTRTMTLDDHVLGVLDVDWSPNGTFLVSGSRDYKVRLWDAQTGESIDRWTEPNCIRSVHWHPDKGLIANSGVGETMLKIRNATTGTVIKTFTESADSKSVVMSSRWSHDGLKLAAGAGLEHALRVYSFGISSEKESKEIPSWVPGTVLFMAITAIVVVLIMIPVLGKLQESGR
ncbi:MAG: WD40 repeat domain-containing protein [Thermoplasmata archaeon]|nr:MAG: WD40 repeat domain-containing protein [Thermoplasmata archaeon]